MEGIILHIKEHYITVPYLKSERRVRVLLPEDYGVDTTTTYPVVYFHDGQNVFYDEDSYSGHSWGVISTIKNNLDLSPMIVVGIDNDAERRMDEYTPWSITDSPFFKDVEIEGLGVEYATFVMDVVKPFIDETYRTKSDKKHTAMIGSSAGGNISSYMGVEYQEEIGCLGIFSLANWIAPGAFKDFLTKQSLDLDQLIFIQVGTQEDEELELKQAYIDCSVDYARQLLLKGLPLENVSLNISADDRHNEKAWARHLNHCFEFLSQDW